MASALCAVLLPSLGTVVRQSLQPLTGVLKTACAKPGAGANAVCTLAARHGSPSTADPIRAAIKMEVVAVRGVVVWAQHG